ncbi:hypothetical protein DRQ33_05810 [bacterium]|nr:MAG: hypothetical protein DRQ33_05810 [bacterium]
MRIKKMSVSIVLVLILAFWVYAIPADECKKKLDNAKNDLQFKNYKSAYKTSIAVVYDCPELAESYSVLTRSFIEWYKFAKKESLSRDDASEMKEWKNSLNKCIKICLDGIKKIRNSDSTYIDLIDDLGSINNYSNAYEDSIRDALMHELNYWFVQKDTLKFHTISLKIGNYFMDIEGSKKFRDSLSNKEVMDKTMRRWVQKTVVELEDIIKQKMVHIARTIIKMIFVVSETHYQMVGCYAPCDSSSGVSLGRWQFNDASTKNTEWNGIVGILLEHPSNESGFDIPVHLRFTFSIEKSGTDFEVHADPSSSWDKYARDISPIIIDDMGRITGGTW